MLTNVGLIVLISLLILIALLSVAEYRLNLRDSWAKYRTWRALKRKYNASAVDVNFFKFCLMNASDKNSALYNWLATNLNESDIANMQKNYSHLRNSEKAYGAQRRAHWGVRQYYQYDWIMRCLPHRM